MIVEPPVAGREGFPYRLLAKPKFPPERHYWAVSKNESLMGETPKTALVRLITGAPTAILFKPLSLITIAAATSLSILNPHS